MDDFEDEKYMENMSDVDIKAQLEGAFFFCVTWAMGGTLEINSRPKFNLLVRGFFEKEYPESTKEALGLPFDIQKPERPYIFLPPLRETVFDFRYIKEVKLYLM